MLLITPLIKDWCYQHELEQCSPDCQVMKMIYNVISIINSIDIKKINHFESIKGILK